MKLQANLAVAALTAAFDCPTIVVGRDDERGPKLARVIHPKKPARVDEELVSVLAKDAVIGRCRHENPFFGPRALLVKDLINRQSRLALIGLTPSKPDE